MRKRAAVHVFELTTDRHTVRDAARANAALGGQVAQKVRRSFAFDGGIRREDQLAHLAFIEQTFQLTHAELLRPDAIERREMPHQHEVVPAKTSRLFYRYDIRRRFDDANQRRIPM